MLRILFSLLISLSAFTIAAQETGVTVKVQTSKGEPLPLASVIIKGIPDTTNIKSGITDSTGSVTFLLVTGKPYRISASLVGYGGFEKGVTIKGDNPAYTMKLDVVSTSLVGVTIRASRPIMRQEDDKTIVDPEALAASSTNAFEIMEKTPGLFVDQDGNIYLNSTTPATVYINGREQKMSTADIATMLKSLPPNSIATIEIMRTPSARYDASGGGGIVNVILKKGVRIGLTGSMQAGLSQGTYGNRFAGINLNNNNGALTTYLNLQYSTRNTFDVLQTDRFFSSDTVLSQAARTKYPTNSFYTGFGVGYQVNKQWEVAYDGRLSINRSQNRSTNLSEVIRLSTGDRIQRNEALVQNRGKSFNLTQSVSAKHKLDSIGSEWTTDFSYTYSPNKTVQDLTTVNSRPNSFTTTSDGIIDNKLHFFSGGTNILKKARARLTLEAGIKTTLVRFTNNTDYFNGLDTVRIKNPGRSGAYQYSENINSAYLQASKTAFGITLKMGARLENTNMKGDQLSPRDTSFTLKRTDLFPYVYLSRGIMKIMGYDLRAYLVFRRTINRPAYEYLNPSIRVIDPFLFETGNPTLRPQFTNNYEANVSFEERPVLAFGYNDTKDIFTQVVYPSDSNRLSRTYDNLGTNKETYFRALGALPPGGRYFVVAGAQYNHNFYQGLIEGNKPLSFKRGSWSLFTYQTFKVTPLMTLSVNGFVRFNGMQQFYELSTFGALRGSLSQQFLKKKLTLTVSGEDLFYTNRNTFQLAQGSIRAQGSRRSDTRRFGLNLRYNFGFRKREENLAIPEESPEKGS